MTPDKNTVKNLISLSDEEMISVIIKICNDNGIDYSRLGLGKGTMGILRSVLSNASDADIERFLGSLKGRAGK